MISLTSRHRSLTLLPFLPLLLLLLLLLLIVPLSTSYPPDQSPSSSSSSISTSNNGHPLLLQTNGATTTPADDDDHQDHDDDHEDHDEDHEERDALIIKLSALPTLCIGVPLQLGSLWIFWSRRNLFPINVRMPKLVLFTGLINLLWFAFTATALLLHTAIPCSIRYDVMMLFSCFCGNSIIIRFVSLVIRFEIANEQVKVASNNNNHGNNSDAGKTVSGGGGLGSLLASNRWVLDQKNMAYANLILNVIFTLIVVCIILINPQESELHHIVCNPSYIANFWTAYTVFLVLVFVLLAYRTRRFSDAFFLKPELTLLTLLCLIPLLLVIVMVYAPALERLFFVDIEIPWIEIIIQIYCLASTLCFTLFPVYKSYKHDSSGDGSPKLGGSLKSKTNSTSRRSHQTDEGDQLEISDLKDPHVSREKKFNFVLKNENLCKSFEAYLVTEFSHENLKFYRQVEAFEASLQTATPDQTQAAAKRIFDLYIKRNALLQINIDGNHYEEIERGFVSNGSTDYSKLFDAAKKHVYLLMCRDSLRRFIESRYFKQLLQLQKGSP